MKDRFEEFYPTIPTLLGRIHLKLNRLWGKMQVLEMIEHLTTGFELSMTFEEYEITTPKESLPAYVGFLMSNKPFPQGATMPQAYSDFPSPNRQTLETAKERFLEQLRLLKQETETNPDYWFYHPIFGKLNAEQTRQLHHKHIQHHFMQFGVLQIND